jgi:hypothetical protein
MQHDVLMCIHTVEEPSQVTKHTLDILVISLCVMRPANLRSLRDCQEN